MYNLFIIVFFLILMFKKVPTLINAWQKTIKKYILQSHWQNNEVDVSRAILETPDKSTPSRWQKQNIQRRKKEKAKTKRNLGHCYESNRGKKVNNRMIGPPCKCQKKCREKMIEKRIQIFNDFWNLGSYTRQNTYLFECIKAVPKNRSYKNKIKSQASSRKINYQY